MTWKYYYLWKSEELSHHDLSDQILTASTPINSRCFPEIPISIPLQSLSTQIHEATFKWEPCVQSVCTNQMLLVPTQSQHKTEFKGKTITLYTSETTVQANP